MGMDDMEYKACPKCNTELKDGICPKCGYEKTKNKMDNIQRFDYYDAPDKWQMTSTFQHTPEGYLKGRAIVTNVGVFKYRNEDGTPRYELRLPEEVFDGASLESLKLKPLTNDHPSELITPDNIKNYQVGNLGDNPSSTPQKFDWSGKYIENNKLTDGYHVAVDICITDKNTIADVENGKRGLSCGYTCDLEKAEDGAKWCGIDYDFIQRNIRYNHVAIVDRARAGDDARIRMDGISVNIKNDNEEETNMPDVFKKVNLDGVEYQAEAPVLTALHTAKERADKAEIALKDTLTEKSKLEADRDTHKDRADKAEKELRELKEAGPDQTRIDAAVNAKLRLMKGAELAGVEMKADSVDKDIKTEVIKKVYPTANLDGKDEVYIEARFDAAMEDLEAGKKNDAANNAFHKDGFVPKNTDTGKPDEYNADAARERMMERMRKDSRGEQ